MNEEKRCFEAISVICKSVVNRKILVRWGDVVDEAQSESGEEPIEIGFHRSVVGEPCDNAQIVKRAAQLKTKETQSSPLCDEQWSVLTSYCALQIKVGENFFII